jgi:microcystin degradation protein MlrC
MAAFRVFAAGMKHESHSFCSLPADLDRFKAGGGYKRWGEISAAFRGTNTEWGAVLDLADKHGWIVIHPLDANTSPAGPVPGETYEHFAHVILSALRSAMPVQGVFLTLHGAMVTTHLPDAEGELVRRVRGVVGPSVPVAVTLDLHANAGPALAEFADIVSCYRTTPHVDMHETASRAGELLQAAMLGTVKPVVAYAQRPMMNALDQGRTISGHGPMVDILKRADAERASDNALLDIGINAGFDWSDKINVGPSIFVTANGDRAKAQAAAERLMDFAWETRDIKTIRLLPMDEAMAIARAPAEGPGPLLIGDYTDCPGGAGVGDGTNLLAAMIANDLQGAALGSIADGAAAQACIAAGVGASVTLDLGGKFDPANGGGPLRVTGVVKAVSDGRVVRKGPFATGSVTNYGPSALLQVGGIAVVVATHRVQIDDREQFRIFGLQPETMNILACKAMNHFRADYEKMGRRLIYVESGGITSFDWSKYPYRNIRRPIWPLDDVK